jgi:hypothetical protein
MKDDDEFRPEPGEKEKIVEQLQQALGSGVVITGGMEFVRPPLPPPPTGPITHREAKQIAKAKPLQEVVYMSKSTARAVNRNLAMIAKAKAKEQQPK